MKTRLYNTPSPTLHSVKCSDVTQWKQGYIRPPPHTSMFFKLCFSSNIHEILLGLIWSPGKMTNNASWIAPSATMQLPVFFFLITPICVETAPIHIHLCWPASCIVTYLRPHCGKVWLLTICVINKMQMRNYQQKILMTSNNSFRVDFWGHKRAYKTTISSLSRLHMLIVRQKKASVPINTAFPNRVGR